MELSLVKVKNCFSLLVTQIFIENYKIEGCMPKDFMKLK